MINGKNKLHTILTILISSCVSACQPIITTERAAIAVFNDTTTTLGYELKLSGQWSTRVNVDAGKFDYAITYEAQANESTVPDYIEQIKIATSSCSGEMSGHDLVKHFKKDPEGRLRWNLHITPNFLQLIGCGSK